MIMRHPRLMLGALLFINVLAYVDRSMLFAFAPQITRDIALDNTQFGFLSGAVWVLSYSVMVLVFGTLADRFSRTRIIAGGMLVWSLCTAASGMAQDFGHLVLARLLVAAGEAALGPSATALLADLFDSRHRSTANGLFFMGIPLGIGCAYMLSGTIGPTLGWRGTFIALGVIGALIALCLAPIRDERAAAAQEHGMRFLPQMRALLTVLREQPAVMLVIGGFVLVHLVHAQGSFIQLWLVRERGASEAAMAQQLGMLQIVFGCLGAAGGGLAADRLARGMRSRLAAFPAFTLLVCLPLMIASRFADLHSPFLYAGVGATFFVCFALYGSSLNLIQGSVPHRMLASVVGFTMMSINIFAVALGTLALGFASDRLGAAGHQHPIGTVLLGTDALICLAVLLYGLAARSIARSQASRAESAPGQAGA